MPLIIAFIAFAEDFDSLRSDQSDEANDILALFRGMQFRTLPPFWFWNIPTVGQYLDGLGWITRRINMKFLNLVKDYEASCDKADNSTRSNSFLAKVVSLSKRETTAMSEERMIGNLITMLAAGYESTHVTICSCLWEIATDIAGLQDKLAAEVQAVSNFDDACTNDLTEAMPRLRSLIYEVVHIKVPAALLGVESVNDFTLDGVVLPPRTKSIMALGYISTLDSSGPRSGPNGERPGELGARRWLVSKGTTKPNEHSIKISVLKPSASMGGCMAFSTGFGTGLRLCPGMDSAEIEALVCVASLLRSFKMSLKEGHPPMKLVMRFTQSPDVDSRLVLKPRARA